MSEDNEYDRAAAANSRSQEKKRRSRIDAALGLVEVLEMQGVAPETIRAELRRLAMEMKGEQ